jgi:hypothetical protein
MGLILSALSLLGVFAGTGGVSGGRSGSERRYVACVSRSFVYWPLIDFFGADFHLALAAKTSSAFVIRSKGSTSCGNANEQRFGFERQGAILLPSVDRACQNFQPSG